MDRQTFRKVTDTQIHQLKVVYGQTDTSVVPRQTHNSFSYRHTNPLVESGLCTDRHFGWRWSMDIGQTYTLG